MAPYLAIFVAAIALVILRAWQERKRRERRKRMLENIRSALDV
jgi:Flp pilus assembly protein TadB